MAVTKGLRRFCMILCHTMVRPLSCGKVGWKSTLPGAVIMGLVSELISIAKSSSNSEFVIQEVCSGIQLLFALTSCFDNS